MAIVKVVFKDTSLVGGEYTMLFGDSYKSWKQQYSEYLRRFNDIPVKAFKSRSKWKGWGGLKWCSEENFQEELNREGCQINDPDNPKPRQYSRMTFYQVPLSDLPNHQ